MLEHHLQKQILYSLMTNPCARFAELKPPDVEGNIFTYHLRQLIRQKYVVKNEDGTYGLTSLGKAVGININLTAKELLEQAHAVFLIVIRDGDKWLLRKRLAHPMYGRYGFVHGEPIAHEDLQTSANKALQERMGLSATYKPLGSAYIKIFQNDELESFSSCLILEANNVQGELIEFVGNGQNQWLEGSDFTDEKMIPSMNDLVDLINDSENQFFTELEYKL